MKKKLVLPLSCIILFYVIAGIYYEFVLPYPVLQNTFTLDETNQDYEIEYNDPDISYRDLIVEIKNINGSTVEIIYTKCSDEARLYLDDGESGSFHHNFAGNILVRRQNPTGVINCSFKVIDRASFLIPKSASTACTDFSRFVFFFNISLILFSALALVVIGYVVIYRNDLLRKFVKLD